MEETLKEYGRAKLQIKKLEDRAAYLKKVIEEKYADHLPEEPTLEGEFKMVGRKQYVYSDEYFDLKDKVDQLRVDEEEQQEPTLKYSLRFTPNKD